MNVRGVTNSTYLYALNNKNFKNKSIIFYNKKTLGIKLR